jgi:hypothetical protein
MKLLGEAAAALESVRPNTTRDLHNALHYEPSTFRAMTQLAGPERGAELVGAIRHEEQVRRDPALQAERLVKEWKRLEAQHELLDSGYAFDTRARDATFSVIRVSIRSNNVAISVSFSACVREEKSGAGLTLPLIRLSKMSHWTTLDFSLGCCIDPSSAWGRARTPATARHHPLFEPLSWHHLFFHQRSRLRVTIGQKLTPRRHQFFKTLALGALGPATEGRFSGRFLEYGLRHQYRGAKGRRPSDDQMEG